MEKYHILPFLGTLSSEKLCCPHALQQRSKGQKESGDLAARESLSLPDPPARSCLSLEVRALKQKVESPSLPSLSKP